MTNFRLLAAAAAAALLAGCAAPDIDRAVEQANRMAPGFTQGNLALSRTEQDRRERVALAEQLLAKQLSMDDAVRVALANSPAMQAVIATSWADLAAASQAGRIQNPVFTFDRLRVAHEVEIERLLTFGLFDLLTLPARLQIARNQQEQSRTQLVINVVDQVSRVRAAWVKAVAARQGAGYAQQVMRAASAGAQLARRMQEAGNFSKLQRAREQAFYADAAAQLALAQQAASDTREELVRALGLTDAQAARLQLPERLPDLPAAPRSQTDIGASALPQRLDVQLARLQLDIAGKSQGLSLLKSLVDVEAGVRHDTVFPNEPGGSRSTHNGYELSMRVPLFDWGGAQSAAMNAQSLAAANRYDATVRSASSQVRQTYFAYRTAFDVAKHFRDEIVPLRKTISDENMLRYNGMLIGVFELLADARDQVASIRAAISAQQQFWLADAALSSTLVGRPLAITAAAVAPAAAADPNAD